MVRRRLKCDYNSAGLFFSMPEFPIFESVKKSEINDMENYLWLFTKNWPNIYEVYDNNNNYSLQITGDTHMMKNTEWGAVAYLSYSSTALSTAKSSVSATPSFNWIKPIMP